MSVKWMCGGCSCFMGPEFWPVGSTTHPLHGTNILPLQPLLLHTGLYVRDIVEEGAERRYGLVADVLKFDHEMAA